MLLLRLRKLYSLYSLAVFLRQGCRIPKLFHHLLGRLHCSSLLDYILICPSLLLPAFLSHPLYREQLQGPFMGGISQRRRGHSHLQFLNQLLPPLQPAEAFSNKLEFSLIRQSYPQRNAKFSCSIASAGALQNAKVKCNSFVFHRTGVLSGECGTL